MVNVTGTEFNDFLDGSVGDDNINGLGGSDIIVSLTGNDVLTGGAGADIFFGSIDQQNNDTITDFTVGAPGSANADRISVQFGSAATTSVTFDTVGNDLRVNIFDSGLFASVLLQGLGGITPGVVIENNPDLLTADIFITNDGTGDTGGGDNGGGDNGGGGGGTGEFDDLIPTVSGDDGPNLLFGTDNDDIIDAGAGNDTIVPGPGDDIILTGGGADALFGLPGTLDGDVVGDFTTGTGGTADFLVLSTVNNPNEVNQSFQVVGDDLVVTLTTSGSTDVVTLANVGVRNAQVTFQEQLGTTVGLPDGTAVFVSVNTAGNQAPVATDDVFTAVAGAAVTGNVITGDNGNGADSDDGDTGGIGNPLQVISIAQGDTVTNITGDDQVVTLANGTLTIGRDGDISYELTDGSTETDTITYTVTDGAATASATVTFSRVNNTAPVAANDSFTAAPGQQFTRTAATGVLANDTDADGDTLTVASVNGEAASVGTAITLTDGQGTTTGTLNLAQDGSFVFIPSPGVTSATFDYAATDGTDTDTGTVTISVGTGGGDGGGDGGGNTNVGAVNDSFTIEDGETLVVSLTEGLLSNDTGSNLSVVTAAGQAITAGTTELIDLNGQGILSISSDGTFSFSGAPGTEDAVTFDYTVTDGTETSVATVTIDFGIDFLTLGTDQTDRFELVNSLDNNSIDGAGGNDFIITGDGNDTVSGGAGDDFIDDNDNQDADGNILLGGDGNDEIIGRAGSYEIDGEAGNDNITVFAALGTNQVDGGDGDDVIELRRGTDNTIDGGAGNDRILIRKTIFDEVGLRNTVLGGTGDDTIEVRDGFLNVIDGGAGNDLLIGGSGSDTFRFSSGFGNDTVRNFAAQGFDQIDLSAFTGLTFTEFQSQVQDQGNGTFVWSPAGSSDTLTIEGLNFELNEVFFIFDGA